MSSSLARLPRILSLEFIQGGGLSRLKLLEECFFTRSFNSSLNPFGIILFKRAACTKLHCKLFWARREVDFGFDVEEVLVVSI